MQRTRKTSRAAAKLAALAILTLSHGASCGDDHDHDHDHDHGVKTQPLTIQFEAVLGDKPFACGQTYQVGASQTPVEFTDLKLYLHDVRLIRAQGQEVPVTLVEDNLWQSNGVAMLDFEDASGACANGTPAVRTALTAQAPAHDDVVGVRFTLGVPFALNHADVGALGSPLNVPSMFWSWQGGRKFLRLDGRIQGPDGPVGLRVHLGSTGCIGEVDAITSCMAANRPTFTIMGLKTSSGKVRLDLEPLLDGVALDPLDERSAVCMSAPQTPSCGPIFGALGLPYGDSPASTPTIFSVGQ